VCGSNLAGLTLLYIVLPCVAAVVSALRGECRYSMIARFDCSRYCYYLKMTQKVAKNNGDWKMTDLIKFFISLS